MTAYAMQKRKARAVKGLYHQRAELVGSMKKAAEKAGHTQVKTVRAVCPHDCPDTCAMLVDVDDDGRAVRVTGDPSNPFTHGGLCVKVAHYEKRTYHSGPRCFIR